MRKIFGLLAAFVLAAGFTACEGDNVDYNPAKPLEGTQVYFATDAPTAFKVDATSTSVAATVSRSDAEGALEVSISATIDTEYASLFTVAPTALFADGETTAAVQISFDRSKLVDGASYVITLSVVDESLHTPYAPTTQVFTITVPEPYVLLGVGLFGEDLLASGYGLPTEQFAVEIYENLNTPGYIYLKDPYKNHSLAAQFAALYENVYVAINVAYGGEAGVAMIPVQKWGVDATGDGQLIVGTSQLGTYKDGMITFPKNGLLVAEELYNNGEWYSYGNTSGEFFVAMPGVELTDYAMTVAYGGMQVEADNTTVSAVLNGTYGADVASMRYAYFDGDVTGAAAQAAEIIIAAAEEEVGVKKFEQGLDEEDRVFSIVESELVAPAVYTVFCVPYNAAGEPQAAATAAVSFYFPGMGGVEAPECEFACALFPFSAGYEPTAEENDSNAILFGLAGVDITAASYALYATDSYEGFIAEGYPLEAFVDPDPAGRDAVPAEYVPYINSEYGLMGTYTDLPAGTSFTLVAYGKNMYGSETYVASEPLSTAATYEAAAAAQKTLVGEGMLKSLENGLKIQWKERVIK